MENSVYICGVDTSKLPRLTDKESREMLEKISQGDVQTRERFIIANMRLALSVIKRFRSKNACADDLFQSAMIGLIKAIDNFDLRYNVKFSTYAVPMIIGEVKRYLRGSNSLRIARSIRDTAYRVLQVRGEIEKRNEEATIEKIASEMNVPVKEVVYALDAIADTVSIYEPVYSKNGDELLLVDQIGDQKNTDENWTEMIVLRGALDSLKERERKIIRLRYFEGKTQTEISAEVGISQAQVSRIEQNALKEIKEKIRA